MILTLGRAVRENIGTRRYCKLKKSTKIAGRFSLGATLLAFVTANVMAQPAGGMGPCRGMGGGMKGGMMPPTPPEAGPPGQSQQQPAQQ